MPATADPPAQALRPLILTPGTSRLPSRSVSVSASSSSSSSGSSATRLSAVPGSTSASASGPTSAPAFTRPAGSFPLGSTTAPSPLQSSSGTVPSASLPLPSLGTRRIVSTGTKVPTRAATAPVVPIAELRAHVYSKRPSISSLASLDMNAGTSMSPSLNSPPAIGPSDATATGTPSTGTSATNTTNMTNGGNMNASTTSLTPMSSPAVPDSDNVKEGLSHASAASTSGPSPASSLASLSLSLTPSPTTPTMTTPRRVPRTTTPGGSGSVSAPGSAKAKTYMSISRDGGRPGSAPRPTHTHSVTADILSDAHNTYITPPVSPNVALLPVDANVKKSKDKVSADKDSDAAASSPKDAKESKVDARTSSGHARTASKSSLSRRASTAHPTGPRAAPPHMRSASTTTLNETIRTGGSSEAAQLASLLRGRTELEILKMFVMGKEQIRRVKGIMYDDPGRTLLRLLGPAEADALKRAVALYDFYWFTHKLDADVLSAFTSKVALDDVREIAADEPEDDEEDVDAEPATRRVNGITVSPYAVSVPAPKYAAPKEDEAEVDPCPTPPNETRVDPRTRYLDAEERHLRRMGRRCASGAALVAAQKRALREGTAAATEDAPAALPAVAA